MDHGDHFGQAKIVEHATYWISLHSFIYVGQDEDLITFASPQINLVAKVFQNLVPWADG